MKPLSIALVSLVLAVSALAQTPATPVAFSGTTFNFNLTPLQLPGQATLSGAEQDAMLNITPNNIIGETTLISSSPFIGGRYERNFPSVSKWIQNNTAFNGEQFEAGFTASVGVVNAPGGKYWGERGGIFLKWAPNGSTSWSVGADIEANNLPGIARWTPSVAIGPNFRF